MRGWSDASLFGTLLTGLTLLTSLSIGSIRSIRSSVISLGLLILLLPGCEHSRDRSTDAADGGRIAVLDPRAARRRRLRVHVEIPSAFHVMRGRSRTGNRVRTACPGARRTARRRSRLVGGRLLLGSMPLAEPGGRDQPRAAARLRPQRPGVPRQAQADRQSRRTDLRRAEPGAAGALSGGRRRRGDARLLGAAGPESPGHRRTHLLPVHQEPLRGQSQLRREPDPGRARSTAASPPNPRRSGTRSTARSARS